MKRIFKKKSQCCGCGACKAVCPGRAIVMAPDSEGFSYPKVNKKACIDCGRCEAVCPINYHHKHEMTEKCIYLGTQAKDDRVRFSSSSGGVFPILARYILSCGGVIFGATMDFNGVVYHKDIQSVEEIGPLQKSKYVQSEMADCFEKIGNYLKSGRKVLFAGTPCQCQAVKQYIGKKDDKLLLVDLVCYGVASPEVWKKYIGELEKKYHGKVSDFCFRDKREKDNGHTVSMKIDGKEHAYSMDQDIFCKLYFRNCIIRPSCYSCRFCTPERESDMTIGDFWGIEKIKPDMNDGMGTSLVILHSKNACNIWEEVKDNFYFFPCKREDALQPRLCSSTPCSKRRWGFFMLNKLLPIGVTHKLMRK